MSDFTLARQMSPSVENHRVCPRRLRLTHEDGDLSELAIEHTSPSGKARSDARNRVLLLEDEDLLWLDEVLHPLAEKLRAREVPPVSETRLNSYGGSTLTASIAEHFAEHLR